MTNRRDERGWRIPRKGTKSYEIYHLLRANFKPEEIAALYGEKDSNNIRVLSYNIRHPERHKARAVKYYNKHNKKTNRPPYRKKTRIEQFMIALGVSRDTAVAIDDAFLENLNENKNRLQLPSGGGSPA